MFYICLFCSVLYQCICSCKFFILHCLYNILYFNSTKFKTFLFSIFQGSPLPPKSATREVKNKGGAIKSTRGRDGLQQVSQPPSPQAHATGASLVIAPGGNWFQTGFNTQQPGVFRVNNETLRLFFINHRLLTPVFFAWLTFTTLK